MINVEYNKIMDEMREYMGDDVIELCKTMPLERHLKFLKEEYDIDDIPTLLKDEHRKVCQEIDTLLAYRTHEQEKANRLDPDNYTELSEDGVIAREILDYLHYLWGLNETRKIERKIEKHKRKMMKRNRMH